MFVNPDRTISSPIKFDKTDFGDLWTTIQQGLASKPSDTVLLMDQSCNNTVTIHQFLTKVDYIAAHLVRHGLNRDVPVTIVMVNCPEFLFITFAVWSVGGKVATVNPMSTAGDVTKYLQLLESEFVFCDNMTAKTVVTGSTGTKTKKMFVNGSYPGCIGMDSLLVPAPKVNSSGIHINKTDVALIQFSSGTTGFPKGVELTHYGLSKMLHSFSLPETGFSAGNCNLIFQPLSHIYGMGVACVGMQFGQQIILMARFDMDEYLQLVVKYKITSLFLVPPLAVLLTKGGFVKKYDLSHISIIFCGAAPLSDEVIDVLKQQMGSHVELRQLYAMTESPGTFYPSRDQFPNAPKHSVGLPFPGTKLKIIDVETGMAVGPMTRGEICSLSDFRMKGYFKNKEATDNMIDKDGWLHTGDIGYYDHEGYIFIVDRLKELIKYKGLQVPPAELENVLLSHPDVADAGVTGLPDQLAGELPFAYVVLSPGSKLTQKQLHAFVNERVAKYKQLRGGIKFVAQIPKSPSGKILRRIIKQEQMGKTAAKL